MAKITMGPLVGSVKGKLGSVVFSSWKGRAYAKNMPITVANPRTPDQGRVRTNLANISKSWRALDPVLKTLWEEYSQSFSGIAPIGTTALIPSHSNLMSGFNAFQSINTRLLNIGLEMVNTPPNISAPSPSNFEIINNYNHSFDVEVTIPADTVAENDVLRIFIKAGLEGSNAYNAVNHKFTAGEITPGSDTVITYNFPVVRMGGGHNFAEVPLWLLQDISIQVQSDVVLLNGAKGSPSGILNFYISQDVETEISTFYNATSVGYKADTDAYVVLASCGATDVQIFAGMLKGAQVRLGLDWTAITGAADLAALVILGVEDTIADACLQNDLIPIAGSETLSNPWI
jgi:hypothetical protein